MIKTDIELPPGDYVSPGYSRILLDEHFPNIIHVTDNDLVNKLENVTNRKLHHNHYADSREPECGFVNRDEAHILYNTALRYKDVRCLEIGCWFGWSTCHLLASGITLDVIDPVLQQDAVRESVVSSVNSCQLIDKVRFCPATSPNMVAQMGHRENLKWSLFFIDGYHWAPGPLVDAFICTRFAESDALILFHDLWIPDVVEALDWLKSQGWNTVIYNTFAIMGAAWRGNMEPIHHEPDPTVSWTIPENLKEYQLAKSEA